MPTKIEWTDDSWNPLRARNKETGHAGHFCVHVSPACEHCYAEGMQPRLFGNPVRYAAQDADKVELFVPQKILEQPLRWRRPRRIFVCSMTDLFYEGYSEEMIDQVFATMALAGHHQYQVLTKRPERMRQYLTSIEDGDTRLEGARDALIEGMAQKQHHERTGEDPSLWLAVNLPLENVWLGVSVEDRARKARIDLLRQTEAAVRFLSIEPLLEDLGELDLTGIHWVIVGGESGNGARPMHGRCTADAPGRSATSAWRPASPSTSSSGVSGERPRLIKQSSLESVASTCCRMARTRWATISPPLSAWTPKKLRPF